MTSIGYELARAYERDELCGWAERRHPGIAKEQFNLIRSSFTDFRIANQTVPTAGRRMFLWQLCRQVLGQDTENYPQQVGDCLVADTMVLMSDGSEKPIQDIQVGEYVISHKNVARRVIRRIEKPYSGDLVTVTAHGNRRLVTATPDHQFVQVNPELDETKWTPVGEMSVGQYLLLPRSGLSSETIVARSSAEGVSVSISSVSHIDSDTTVYCLEVEEDHSFIANGFAAKNCVSFGAKNATEYLSCAQIVGHALVNQGREQKSYEELLAQGRIKFRRVFPPYYYGTGRVYIGKGRLGNGDGSLGSWQAQAVMKYGTLFSDEQGVPQYAGRIAKAWGDPSPSGDLDKWVSVADQYDVKSAALIKSWDEYVAAICNGYACTTASNLGYSMEPGRDGFHVQNASWAHQMCAVGVDDEHSDSYAVLLNSWGDVHGRLKCFHDGHEYPKGTLRIRRKDMEKHIRAGELFAFSNFLGFPEQRLDKALFKLI